LVYNKFHEVQFVLDANLAVALWSILYYACRYLEVSCWLNLLTFHWLLLTNMCELRRAALFHSFHGTGLFGLAHSVWPFRPEPFRSRIISVLVFSAFITIKKETCPKIYCRCTSAAV